MARSRAVGTSIGIGIGFGIGFGIGIGVAIAIAIAIGVEIGMADFPFASERVRVHVRVKSARDRRGVGRRE